jgi:hypothetical protein
MSNRSSTRRSDTQPVNADAYLELEFTPPPPRKRTLDENEYLPASDAQRDFKGETPKKRKLASSLASYAKRNVVQAVATVRGASAEDPAQCVVSGASEQRMVIEFSHVMSGSTSLDDVSVIFFCGRSQCSVTVDGAFRMVMEDEIPQSERRHEEERPNS